MMTRILKLRFGFILALLPWMSAFAGSESPVRIPYGKDPLQFADLRIPAGKGPFPVLILVHGGCWLSAYDLAYFNPLAEWFTKEGFATWTIEYRRLGNPGGGWPNTFLDVALAADALQDLAVKNPLDLKKVYAAGHSAGGQLALWLASRQKLKKESPLYLQNPLIIRGVLGLAAITDLEKYRAAGSCGASVDVLLGGTPLTVPARFEETSPIKRLPLGITQIFIQGERDPIVDLSSVQSYADAAAAAGDHAKILVLPGAGHFEPVTPDAKSEETLRTALHLLTEAAKGP